MNAPLPQRVLYYGKDAPLPDQTPLVAGPLRLVYEAGDLRYIRWGDREILRRIYVAVRDHNWGTALPVLSNVQIEQGQDWFRIAYDVDNRLGDIDFCWHGEIHGEADGAIRFSMDGEAHSTFRRNRIGFCLLHPAECAGAPARIEHVNGTVDEAPLPRLIAPQLVVAGEIKPVAPFQEMAGLAHEVGLGRWVEFRFAGDIFEMEDQRNWTDASFKTYCTPLRLPFPQEIRAGTKVSQAVTLRLRAEAQPAAGASLSSARSGLWLDLATAKPAVDLPRLGLGVASHGQPLHEREIERLRALHLAHLRVDVRLSEPDWEVRLQQAALEARALGAQLETAIFLSDDAENELERLGQALARIQPPVASWLIFHQNEKSTGERWIDLARPVLLAYDPTARIGSGTNVFFTELNRGRPPAHALDLVCYSINPQVHAFDNLSLIETLAAQAATIESARAFSDDKPLAVTPITLRMRFNPNATGPEPAPAAGELPPQVDERQMSLFGAGWTLGSIKYLAEAGTQSLTYYETTGWRGVMETEAGSPLPDRFPSLPGAVFPLYHVLADVGEFAGGQVLPLASNCPMVVEGLALRKAGRQRLLVANLSAETVQINIAGSGATGGNVRFLDETNAIEAMTQPERFRQQPGELLPAPDDVLRLSLRPFAVACVDLRDK